MERLTQLDQRQDSLLQAIKGVDRGLDKLVLHQQLTEVLLEKQEILKQQLENLKRQIK